MNVMAPVSVDILKSILKTMFMNYKTLKEINRFHDARVICIFFISVFLHSTLIAIWYIVVLSK